jgi:membrane associated rhomboid family serine protease
MRTAAVGQHCVDCVREGAAGVRQPRTPFGGRQGSKTPVITYALIAINAAAYVIQIPSSGLRRQLALWPVRVADGELYRLITSAFMHYGLMHILFNMWVLYVVGPPMEAWLGRLRFIALYALSALGGSVLVYLLAPTNSATVGASGAVFGLFGATYVVAKKLQLDVRWVTALIVINLVLTFALPALGSQAISWQGHVGGLVTGALIAATYAYAPRAHRDLVQAGATIATLILFSALIWWRTTDLLSVT